MDTGAGASADDAAARFMRAGIERARRDGLLAVVEQLARCCPTTSPGPRSAGTSS